MVIDLSKFVQSQGWWMAILVGAGGYAFFYFKKRSRPMRRALDRMLLKAPVIGPIMVKAAIARYARVSRRFALRTARLFPTSSTPRCRRLARFRRGS